MERNSFTILLGGALMITGRLKEAVAGSRTIAADGGMRHAEPLGLTPELWVGDFDSADATLLSRWPQIERQPYPAAKAMTDGEIAVSAALARGATALILAGALGGERSDHALQHLIYAVSLAERGIKVMLTSGEEEAWPLLPGAARPIDLQSGALFSVIGLTALEGLDIGNTRYPLENFTLAFGSSRTISNVANGPLALCLKSGRAILLARPYDLTGT